MKWSALVVVLLAACGGGAGDGAALDELPGVTVLSTSVWPDGRTRIIATIDQPLDHDDPASPVFAQRLVIYEVDASAATVIDTEGYDLGDGHGVSEPAALVTGNEVQVEHRFFGASLPETLDWSKLGIEQAAADHHLVVETLRARYRGPWISTGTSKGGIAALAHRRLFPDDVVGTVAYVAPQSVGLADQRFVAAVTALGGGSCGAQLAALQRAALSEPRRTQLAAGVAALVEGAGYHTDVLGPDRILELTTLETPFTFWQYGSPQRCPFIPDAGQADDFAILSFIDSTNFLSSWSDEGVVAYQGYWYAVATQLGYPADDLTGLTDVVRYSDTPTPLQLLIAVTPPPYDPAPMQDVADWVAQAAQALVLVYGGRDPWTAGALDVSGGADTSRHVVAEGNHLSNIGDLPVGERDAVVARVREWANAAR